MIQNLKSGDFCFQEKRAVLIDEKYNKDNEINGLE